MPFRRSSRRGVKEAQPQLEGQPGAVVVQQDLSPVLPFTVPATPKKNEANDTSGLTEYDTSFDDQGFVVTPPPECKRTPNASAVVRAGSNPQRQELADLLRRNDNFDFITTPPNKAGITSKKKKNGSKRGGGAGGPQKHFKKINSLEDLEDQEKSPTRREFINTPIININWNIPGNSNKKQANKNPTGKYTNGFKRVSSSNRSVNKKNTLTSGGEQGNNKHNVSVTTNNKYEALDNAEENPWKNTTKTEECEWRMYDSEQLLSSEGFVSFTPILSRPLSSTAVSLSMLSSRMLNEEDDGGGSYGQLLLDQVWNDPPDVMVRDSIYRHIQICRDLNSDGVDSNKRSDKANETTNSAAPVSIPIDVDDCSFIEADPETVDEVALQNIAEGKPHAALDFLNVLLQDQRRERVDDFTEVVLESKIATTKSHLALVSLLAMSPKEAWQYSMSALQTHQKAGRPVQTAFSTIELGLVLMGTDQLKKALKTWRQALQLTCKAVGYDHGQVALLLSNIGCLHFYLHNHVASLRALEESLGLQRQLLRSISPEDSVEMPLFNMATTMGNLALVSAKFKNYDAAVSLLEEASAIQESISVTSAKVKATTQGYLARFEKLRDEDHDINENDDKTSCVSMQDSALCTTGAASIFGDTDGIPRRHEGTKHHPIVSQSPAGEDDNTFDSLELGSLVKRSTARQRVHDTVVRSLERSLIGQNGSMFATPNATRKKQSIPVDVDADSVIDAENHLEEIHLQALNHLAHKEYKDAFDLFQMSLRSHKDKYGDVHHLVGTALHNCGTVNMVAKQYALAKPFFQEAVSVRTTALGATHPDVAASKYKVGLIQLAGGDLKGALDSFSDVMLQLGADSSSYSFLAEAKMLNNIGVVVFEMGEVLESFSSFFRAYEIQKGLLREGSHCVAVERGLASTLCNLGYLYAEQKQYGDSLDAYSKALAILQVHYPMKSPLIVTIQENIAHVKAYGAVTEDDLLPKCTPLEGEEENHSKVKLPSCVPLNDPANENGQSKVFGSCMAPNSEKEMNPSKKEASTTPVALGEEGHQPPNQSIVEACSVPQAAVPEAEQSKDEFQSKVEPAKGEKNVASPPEELEERSFIQSTFGSCIPEAAELGVGVGENGQHIQSKLTACFHIQ